jgi:hypothetical protein
MQAVLIALVVLVGILGAANILLTLALARRLAQVERTAAAGGAGQPRMPRVGTEIGEFSVDTAGGARLTDATLRGGRTLVVFSLAGCSPCTALAEELRDAELPPGLGLLVLVAGGEGDAEAVTAAQYPSAAQVVHLPSDSGLADQFEVDSFPTVVLVEGGRITAVGRKAGEVLAALAGAPA